MGRWREQHPDITLEIDASQQVVDLARDGFHAGIRTGAGPWPGLAAERLYDGPSPMVAVGAPEAARRLAGLPLEAFAREPLLGERETWVRWFAAAGVVAEPVTVASFHDLGLMLQATEQGLGLAVVRELFAADALQADRLVKLSDVSFIHERATAHSLVYPIGLADWPPLAALRAWLRAEFERSELALKNSRKR